MCKTWFEDEEALNERDSEPSQEKAGFGSQSGSD